MTDSLGSWIWERILTSERLTSLLSVSQPRASTTRRRLTSGRVKASWEGQRCELKRKFW